MRNPYLPELAVIEDVREEALGVKTFTISFKKEKEFDAKPGQFVQVSVFGYGEFPVSVSKIIDSRKGRFQVTVRRMGKVTTKFLDLPPNSVIGIRGPHGNGYPIDKMEGRNVLMIAGGIGLTSIRSLALYLLENKSKYGDLKLLYGARTPSELLFKDFILSEEVRRKGLEILLTVDEPDEKWRGKVGVVTKLLDEVKVDPRTTIVAVCGPSPMLRFASEKLIGLGFSKDDVFLSFERRMQCGIGVCGHCMISHKRVCLDGPVFSLRDVEGVLDRVF
jgi:sulfhydrogenase subunit gamma (sulfur reductase)